MNQNFSRKKEEKKIVLDVFMEWANDLYAKKADTDTWCHNPIKLFSRHRLYSWFNKLERLSTDVAVSRLD